MTLGPAPGHPASRSHRMASDGDRSRPPARASRSTTRRSGMPATPRGKRSRREAGTPALPRPHRQPLGAALVPARGGRARCCACTACSCTRPTRVVTALARNLRRRSRARRRRGAALHERQPAPGAARARARCRRSSPRAASTTSPTVFDRHQRALLRRASCRCRSPGDAGAAARAAAGSPSAATTRCSPSSASTPCSTGRDGAALLPGERRLPRDAAPPDGRGARPRRAHGLPHAGLPRGGGALPRAPRGARLGEGEPAAPAAREPRPRPRAAGRARRRAAAAARARSPLALPHLRRLLPDRHAPPARPGPRPPAPARSPPRSRWRSPWVLRHAIDDLHASRSPAQQALVLRRAAIARPRGRSRASSATRCGWSSSGSAARSSTSCATTSSRHLTRLPARYYQQSRIGELMSRATNDMSAVRMVLGPGIMYTANTVATFVGTVVADDRGSARGSLLPRPRAPRPRLRAGAPLRPPDPRPLRGGAGAARGA